MAEITSVPISTLKRDPDNPNIGTEGGRSLLRHSLHAHGFLEAGVLDKHGRIMDGNQRTDAAQSEGISDALVVHIPDGTKAVFVQRDDLDLDTPEGRSAAIILNRSAQKNINFSPEALNRAASLGVDLSAVGFSDREKLKMGISGQRNGGSFQDSTGELEDPDASPIDVSVELGDLWRVGDAWLYCGDCRNPAALTLLADQVQGAPIVGVVTSPPYALQKEKQYGGVADDQYVAWFEDVQANLYTILSPSGHFFLNIKPHSLDYRRSLYVFDLITALVRRWHWHLIDEFMWKHGGIPGDPVKMGKFKNQFEPIYWLTKQIAPTSPPYPFYPDQVMIPSNAVILDDKYETGVTDEYQGVKTTFANRSVGPGMAYPGNILTGHNTELLGHEAAYPVDIPAFFIQAFSQEGEVWLDPFGGSGTTAVAALNLDRRALLTEIKPDYVRLSIARLARAFGLQPERVGNFPV